MSEIQTLATAALLDDRPDLGLLRGQVGTIVEQLAPGVCEVEFSDQLGRTRATVSLRTEQFLALRGELGPQVA